MNISENNTNEIEIKNDVSTWKGLSQASDHPFLSIEWLEPELCENKSTRVLTGLRNKEPVWALPYIQTFLGQCLLLGGYVSSEQAFITLNSETVSAKTVADALTNFLNKKFLKPVVAMDCIIDEDPVASELAISLVASGWKKMEIPGKKSPYVVITGTFDDYFINVKRSVRKEYQRRTRKLASDYQIQREIIASPKDFDDWLDEIIRVEKSSWKKAYGLFSRGNLKTSVARFRSLAALDKLRVFLLIANKKLIAYDIEFVSGRILWSFNTAFDPGFRKYGPGIDLQLEAIHYAFDHHLDRVELLGDNQPYKQSWSHDSHIRSTVYLFPPGFTSLLGPFILRTAKRIKGIGKK